VTSGLVFGKFMPLHRGHQLLIERALTHVDAVTVAVWDSAPPGPYPAIPLELRTGWLRELYPDLAAIVPLDDPLKDDPERALEPESAPVYAEQVRPLGPFDRVYSGEERYGSFARELGAELVLVEPAPISGTAIRADPYEHREWLDPRVYAGLVQKILFVGTESTGKTTLARTLAERFDTLWAHEYGRELWVERNGQLAFADYLHIGETQHAREVSLRPDARRFIFCDTNAWTTLHWSLRTYGCADARLWELAETTMGDYRWFLCLDDFPWEQDGWREMAGGEAHAFQLRQQADLDARGIPYVTLEGPLEQRVDRVVRALTSDGSRGRTAARPPGSTYGPGRPAGRRAAPRSS
jgi:HTH-type transcriptional regulator, transcriptional repressor of NAD biosynthesis genes